MFMFIYLFLKHPGLPNGEWTIWDKNKSRKFTYEVLEVI